MTKKKIRFKKAEKISLKNGWEKFLRHCKVKDLAEHTITFYKNSYNYFKKFLESIDENAYDLSVDEIDQSLIEDFILWLDDTVTKLYLEDFRLMNTGNINLYSKTNWKGIMMLNWCITGIMPVKT